MLKQRLIFGALGIILALLVLLLCPVHIIGVFVGIISLIGLYELYNVTGIIKKKTPIIYLGFVFCVIINVLTIIKGQDITQYLGYILCAFIFLLMLSNVFFYKKCSFHDASLLFMGTMYVSFFFAHLLMVRQLELGSILVWVLFICAWSTDTFAYFTGMAIGKHKLCPNISPKKTIEGAVGGVVGCIIFVVVYLYIVANINGYDVNYPNAIILALCGSAFSQLGDLVASRIKREYDVKDYGNLIPGHGGILDRFDSCLLISPVIYYLLVYLPVIG